MALKQAMTPEFRVYQRQVVANCRALAETLMELGYKVVTGTNRKCWTAPPLTPGRGCPCSLGWHFKPRTEAWVLQPRLCIICHWHVM